METESKKVDVLYVVGNGSVANNNELRYSLRCLDRHGKNVGRVIISGDIPDFVGGEAVTVPCHDIEVSGKHWNMLHKIEQGIRGAGLSERLLFSCDDHFITRDFDMCKWPQRMRAETIYTAAEWQDRNGKPPGKYQRAIAATGEILRDSRLPTVNVVWHGDMWISPKYLDNVLELARANRLKSIYGFEPILMFDAFYRRDNPDAELVRLPSDVKAKQFGDCMSYSSAYGYFSTADRAWMNGELLKWFKKNYPEKSRWEK